MKRLYPFGFAFLFFSLVLGTLVPNLKRKPGFTLSKIYSPNAYDPQWDVAVSSEKMAEIQSILCQKFTYLASGNHCYTFVSEDDEYVIKFFKQKQITPKSWKSYLAIPSGRLTKEHRKKCRDKTYNSYVIAATKLTEETGTMYLHLTKAPHFSRHLLLIDQHGKAHSINLNKAEFLVQKRADIGFSYLDRMLSEAKVQEAAIAIESLFSLIATRCALGIIDDDCQLWKNFGFRKGKAMEVDIGEFRYGSRDEIIIHQEIGIISDQISQWMAEHYPDYHFLITKAVDNATTKYKLQSKNRI